MTLRTRCLMAWLACAGGLIAIPASAAVNSPIDSGRYADVAAARQAWKPMSDSPPVDLAKYRGAEALEFTCRFAGTTSDRGSWDFATRLDLASARGIRFQLACSNPSPIGSFSLYCQSGRGWYVAPFYSTADGWETVTLDRSQFRTEGEVAGWDAVSTIRLSAWRAVDQDTSFYVRDLRRTGILGDDAAILMVVSPRSHPEHRDSLVHAESLGKRFEESGLTAVRIDDDDLTAETLTLAGLVVLPHTPGLSERSTQLLVEYLQRGGKLLSFYGLPAKLQAATGIQLGQYIRDEQRFGSIRLTGELPGAPAIVPQKSFNIVDAQPLPDSKSRVLAVWYDRQEKPCGNNAILGSPQAIHMTHVLMDDAIAEKRQLLFALAAALVPQFWVERVQNELRHFENVGPYHTLATLESGLRERAAGNAAALQCLAAGLSLRREAEQLIQQQQFVLALQSLHEGRQELLKAYAGTFQPVAGEFRGFWCHNARGVAGLSWDEAIRKLSENGFNAVFANLLWGGGASYESKHLPWMPSILAHGDQAAACLAACRKHGVQLHVWKVNWNLGHDRDPAFLQSLRDQQRLQVKSDGTEEPWLCPSDPDNQQLEVDSMTELVRKYPVDGIHFDYIRYPDNQHCFCDGCRQRFGQVLGRPIADRDELVRLASRPGPDRQIWNDWRRQNITTVVRQTSEQARRINPQIKISAAVFRNWQVDRDVVAQDWSLWCQQGYLDFVCPMDYTRSERQLDAWISRQQGWAHGKPVYPGLGAFELTPEATLGQIEVVRRHQSPGFLVFDYNQQAAQELLPLLGIGATRKE